MREKLFPLEVRPPGSSASRAVRDPEVRKMEVHPAEGKEMRQLRFKHQALSSKGADGSTRPTRLSANKCPRNR